MAAVAPCITVETADDYKATIERLQPFAERVHIDLMDGEFAPTFSVSADMLWWPPEWQVDIHAMVAQPSAYVARLISLQPKLIIFHAEVTEDLLPLFQQIKQAGIKTGVALLKTTVPATVRQYIEAVDHVMIFSGDLGHYGGEASMMQLEKVRLVRGIHPEVEIGWDGGANVHNAFSLAQGSVNVVNVGGAINNANDPQAVYGQLVNEVNKRGVI